MTEPTVPDASARSTAPGRSGPTPDTGRAGIILAGGRSSRFGRLDKATATLGGVPMIRRVAAAVDPVVDELVVNCRPEQRPGLAAALDGYRPRFAEDSIPDRGPVAGLRTALRATEAEYAAVAACDMPFLTTALLATLCRAGRRRTGAVARLDDRIHPFPAVLHVRAATPICTDVILHREGRLCELVEAIDPVVVSEREIRAFADPKAFSNVNTRADLRTAETAR